MRSRTMAKEYDFYCNSCGHEWCAEGMPFCGRYNKPENCPACGAPESEIRYVSDRKAVVFFPVRGQRR